MKTHHILALSGSAMLLLTGCVDDKYDLSDIDTTVELKARDLVLPLNLDKITLGDILDPDADSNLKIINGEYVFTDDGTFDSDPINVEAIDITAPTIDPLHDIINGAASGASVTYPIASSWAGFTYRSDNVSHYILDITKVNTELTLQIQIYVEELRAAVSKMSFANLKLQLPKGLEMTPSHGTYDPATGIIDIPAATVNSGVLTVTADVTAITVPTDAAAFDPDAHSFVFSDRMRIADGLLTISQNDYAGGTLPSQTVLTTVFTFSNLHGTKFSGKVYYEMSGFDINPISLSDLPDFLSQEGTDIKLVNPQIYMTVNNPVGPYSLDARAGLAMTPVRDEVPGTTLSLDNGTFTIPYNDGTGPYTFCISPATPTRYPEGYTNPAHVPFTTLGDIISGNGLPQSINIDIPNAGVSPQSVENFDLGVDIGSVAGNYMFYAPLDLAQDSKIRYVETEDGWNDDTVDKLTIQKLTVRTNATNDTPFDVYLSGYPIDTEGRRINDVDIVGGTLMKGERNKAMTIYITGTVKHLDGITFTASLLTPDDTGAITTSEGITLSDIKVTVTGNYVDEL